MIWDHMTDEERAELERLNGQREGAADNAARSEAEVAIRVQAIRTVLACMERVGEKYAEAAAIVGAAHADLSGAAVLLQEAGFHDDFLGRAHFDEFHIPGSQSLASMRERGEVRQPIWPTYSLAGGEVMVVQRAAEAAAETARRELYARLGGYWPLRRSLAGRERTPNPPAQAKGVTG